MGRAVWRKALYVLMCDVRNAYDKFHEREKGLEEIYTPDQVQRITGGIEWPEYRAFREAVAKVEGFCMALRTTGKAKFAWYSEAENIVRHLGKDKSDGSSDDIRVGYSPSAYQIEPAEEMGGE